MPVQEIKATVLSTELTGSDRNWDAIVSIGAVKLTGGNVEVGHTFYESVNPNRQKKRRYDMIKRIADAEIVEKDGIDSLLFDFLNFCHGDILIGHYMSLDLSIINRELNRIQSPSLENPSLDTLSLVHWWRSHVSGHDGELFSPSGFQLVDVAKELGVYIQGVTNALKNAFLTAQVFQRLSPRLQVLGIRTLGDLLQVGHPNRKIEFSGSMI